MGETPPPSPDELGIEKPGPSPDEIGNIEKETEGEKQGYELDLFLEKQRDKFRTIVEGVENELTDRGVKVDYTDENFWPELFTELQKNKLHIDAVSQSIAQEYSSKGTAKDIKYTRRHFYLVVAARSFGQGLVDAGMLDQRQREEFEQFVPRSLLSPFHLNSKRMWHELYDYYRKLRSELGADKYEQAVDILEQQSNQQQNYMGAPYKLFSGKEMLSQLGSVIDETDSEHALGPEVRKVYKGEGSYFVERYQRPLVEALKKDVGADYKFLAPFVCERGMRFGLYTDPNKLLQREDVAQATKNVFRTILKRSEVMSAANVMDDYTHFSPKIFLPSAVRSVPNAYNDVFRKE